MNPWTNLCLLPTCSHQMSHLEPVFQAPIITLALAMGISRSGPSSVGIGWRRKSRWVDGEVSSPPIFEGGRDEPLCAFSDCSRFFYLKWWCEGKLISIFILISADSVCDILVCRIFVWFCLSLGWLKYTRENQFGAACLSPFPASDRD